MAASKSTPPGDGLNREDIEKLIEVVHQKEIAEFELEQGDLRLRIVSARGRSAPAAAPAAAPPAEAASPAPRPTVNDIVSATASTPRGETPEDANLKKITSPMVGTFYRSSSPGAKPFVEVGDKVDEDTVLCIIEAMKLMNEIKAETRGVIRKIVVENSQPVEYGQTLFLVEPA